MDGYREYGIAIRAGIRRGNNCHLSMEEIISEWLKSLPTVSSSDYHIRLVEAPVEVKFEF